MLLQRSSGLQRLRTSLHRWRLLVRCRSAVLRRLITSCIITGSDTNTDALQKRIQVVPVLLWLAAQRITTRNRR